MLDSFSVEKNNAGAIFVFERESDAWVEAGRFQFPGDEDLWHTGVWGLGVSVDVGQDVIVAGAPGSTGAAFVYERTTQGWHHSAILRDPAPEAADDFGWSVAVDGGTIVVGEPVFVKRRGAAFVFEKGGSGEWNLVQRLEPTDGFVGGDWADAFGMSVDIQGDRIVVGSQNGKFNGPLTGTGYLFLRDTSGSWPKNENERFVTSDPVPGDPQGLGAAIAIDGPYVIAGAPSASVGEDSPGAGYLFEVELGESFCLAKPNSLDRRAHLAITGKETVADRELTLSVHDCPPKVVGMFLMAPGDDQGVKQPLGDGRLCLGWRGIARLRPAVPTGEGGAAIHDLVLEGDLGAKLLPGTTWSFQYLCRDPPGGPAGFNLTNAVALTLQ